MNSTLKNYIYIHWEIELQFPFFIMPLSCLKHQCNSSSLVSLGESLLFVVNETIRGMLSIALLQVWQNFSVDLSGSGFSFFGRLFYNISILFSVTDLFKFRLSSFTFGRLYASRIYVFQIFQFMRIYISIELLTDNLVSIGMCCNLPFLISNFINLSLLFLPFGQFGQVFVNLLIFSKNQFIV